MPTLKDTADIQVVAQDIIDFFKSLIEEIMAVLAKFESHFQFEEEGYNKYEE